MTDPDAFLIDRVFQPLVDRLGLEPRMAAKRTYRVHMVGTLSVLLLSWMLSFRYLAEQSARPSMDGPGITPFEPGIYIGAMVIQIAIQRHFMKAKGPARLDPNMILGRVSYLVLSILICCLTASILVEPRFPVKFGAMLLLFTIFWLTGLVALYVHSCRPPPPPHDQGSMRPMFEW